MTMSTQKIYTPAELEQCVRDGVQLFNADLARHDLKCAALTGARFRRANFADAALTGANFREALLIDATFSRVSAGAADFSSARLSWAKFPRADLRSARFEHAELHHADFAGANLADVDFTDADLSEASFWYASVTLDALQRSRNWDQTKHTIRGIKHLLAQEAREAGHGGEIFPATNAIDAIFNDAQAARAAGEAAARDASPTVDL